MTRPRRPRSGRTSRAVGLVATAGLAAGLLSACQPPAATFTVTTAVDDVDADIGDGICATSTGDCSLRAAVQEGNTNLDAGPIEVVLVDGAMNLTRVGSGEDAAATGDLDLTRPFRFVGSGPGSIINDSTDERILDAVAGAHVEINDATLVADPFLPAGVNGGVVRAVGADVTVSRSQLKEGDVSGVGGLVFVDGTFTATDTTLGGGHAAAGGAIAADRVVLNRVEIGTTSASQGGAILLMDPAATAVSTIDTMTLDGAVASAGSAVTTLGAPLVIHDTTIVRSTGTAGVLGGGAAISIGNSVVSTAGVSGVGCTAAVTSLGGNVESGTGCGFTTPTDRQAAPGLTPTSINRNGNLVLVIDSPLVVDAGTGCLATDLTLLARPGDGDADGVAECDRGAVETTLSPRTYTVSTGADAPDLDPGDGQCTTAAGACTLRAAIQETNAVPTDDAIQIANSVGTITLTRSGIGEDGGSTGDLDISDGLTIAGGATPTTIDANGLDRVFEVHAGTVTLGMLVIVDGAEAVGGAINTAAGSGLTLSKTTIRSSSATNAGGAIRVAGTLAVRQSLIRDNDGRLGGGGILAIGGSTVTIDDSTFTGNASSSGAAIKAAASSTVTVRSSTIAGNLNGPGIEAVGAVSLQNTVLANNGSGNCSGTITSFGHNHDSVTTCGLGATGDVSGTSPLLGALADNGGPTLTMKPIASSPVINTGTCTSTVDQRSSIRPVGAACDKGAVEV